MSLRISTNMSSIGIQNAMHINQRATDKAVKNVATGSRLSNPGSDVSGAAIADQMKAELASMGAARRNSEDAVSFVSIAEGSLNEQSNILMRMRELSVQAASDTYSKTERSMMQKEFGEIRSELDRIAKSTRFGSSNLLDGSSNNFDFQVGTRGDVNSRISFKSDSNTTADSLDIDGASVSDKGDAVDSISSIDKAMEKIAQQRAGFGAVQSRLESADNTLGSQIENLSIARSRIADADIAKEVSDMRRGQILQQYQASALAQANEQSGLALKLIG
ncbi:MAG: hypothetical protein A2622_03210 [Bdellovibrionales bacterium RIFCSPHIGHO2_01_FULL_40_29]|nr:MAG: hypothetical protein A2622_03210 [Bdellovibrionales bacterium RIFCSPHIGHO2_01_FULL_40_29]OFZ34082.1 MAG: hypothetical protein A3D17_03630 [Bdellovibrionales bacterium RIFCSPHIGHO2_02_FULL_40_15]